MGKKKVKRRPKPTTEQTSKQRNIGDARFIKTEEVKYSIILKSTHVAREVVTIECRCGLMLVK